MPGRRLWIIGVVGLATVLLRGWIGTRGLDRDTCAIKSEFDFGFEQGHIAGNLARGNGYSVKFGASPAMPTAWASPLYPLLLAGIFRLWGAFTFESALAVIWLNAIFHGLIASLLYVMGLQLSEGQSGRRSISDDATKRRSDEDVEIRCGSSSPREPGHAMVPPGGNRIGLCAVALFLVMPAGWQFLHWAWCIHLLAVLILAHLLVLMGQFRSPVLQAGLAGGTLALAMLADGAAVTLMPITAVCLMLRTRSRARLASHVEWAEPLLAAVSSGPIGRGTDSCAGRARPGTVSRLAWCALAWLAVMSPFQHSGIRSLEFT